MAGNHTLGTIRGTIEIDYDGRGIVRAQRDTDETKKKSEGLEKAVDRLGKGYSIAAKKAAVMAASSLALHVGLQGVAAVVQGLIALAPVALAGLATLPGVVLAAGAALAIFKVATLGVGDALKAASGDSKQFEEALKKLAPQAQQFARSWKAAGETLKPFQQAVQNAFFSGLGPQVERIARGLASLRGAAVAVAQQFNALGKEALGSIKDIQFEQLEAVLGGVKNFLSGIRGSIKPVIQGFISLAAQASVFGGSLGDKLGNALTKFGNAMKNFDLAAAFDKAKAILDPLLSFLKDLKSIAESVFGALQVNGAGALGVIGELVSQLADFLKTAEGQAALTALGTAMQAISGAAGQVFLALLQALAPTIVALAPGIAQLATQLAAVLVPAINALNPILVALAGFLSDNMDWIGPLAIAIGTAAAAYKTYKAAADGVKAVQSALNSKLATTLVQWGKNAAAVAANTAKMVAHGAVVGAQAVASWARNTASVIANTAAVAANKVAVAASAAAGWAKQAAAVALSTARMIAANVAMAAVKVATIAWTAVQWALNVALNANPIGLIVIAIALLVGAIILLWKNSETFRKIVIAVWEAIKTAALAVVNWFKDTALPFLKKVWDGIVAGFTWLKDKVIAAFNLWLAGVKWYLNLIKTIFTTIWNAIVSFIKTGINNFLAIVNGISALVGKFKQWFGDILNAVKQKFNDVVNLAKGLIGRITGAMGNIGSKLFNAGKSLIQGFIDGIKHMIGAAGDAARSVIDKVTGFFPGSPAKEGPLSGHGYVLLRAQRMMQDMAKGIEKGSQLPVQATAGAVGGVGSSLDTLTGQRAAQPASASAAPSVVRVPSDGRTLTIENLILRGVWDFTEPGAERRVVARLHESLDRYEKEHA